MSSLFGLKWFSPSNPSIPRDISKKLSVVNDLFNFKLNFPIKNFKKKKIIDIACGSGEFAHKPGLIVSISSGNGGAYPISELRSSSYKNSHILWIPENIIIRKSNPYTNTEKNSNNYKGCNI